MQAMVENVEAEDTSMICSILLLDDDGRRLRCGAAPNLPDFYNRAIDGIEIGDGVGSCGTAAHRMQRVIVADINNHPYWEKFKQLAAKAGVGACWSEPIMSSKGRLLGTFAIYYRQPRYPDDETLQLISSAANLASIAIEHYQADQELERQAHTDFLTGVANRRYFMELAEAELNRALRYPEPFSLLMLDIDHFKLVNDSHGHKTGDRVLQRFAAILRETLREVDIVGRMGGEEFAAILPNTGMAEAWDAAERLRLAVAATEMQSDAGSSLQITISVGVATLFNENSIDTLMKRADDALYLAKNNGRNQVCLSEDKPLAGSQQRRLQGF
jgi:diguanylate cyclase (GGDEF)-like protein